MILQATSRTLPNASTPIDGIANDGVSTLQRTTAAQGTIGYGFGSGMVSEMGYGFGSGMVGGQREWTTSLTTRLGKRAQSFWHSNTRYLLQPPLISMIRDAMGRFLPNSSNPIGSIVNDGVSTLQRTTMAQQRREDSHGMVEMEPGLS